MDETVRIPDHPHLAEWMKETNIEGKAFRGELGEISEWAARKALWDWPVGCQVTLEELTDRAHNIQMGLALNSMVDKGLMDMEWSEEHGEMVFSLTPGGKDWAKEHGK
tara:strand:- start:547 stop:870 length:324 start_codon:yes stop_codon:yes gene_type:complete